MKRRKFKRADRALAPMRRVVVTRVVGLDNRPVDLQVPTDERVYDRHGNDITGNYHRYLKNLTLEEAEALRDALTEVLA